MSQGCEQRQPTFRETNAQIRNRELQQANNTKQSSEHLEVQSKNLHKILLVIKTNIQSIILGN